MTDITPIDLNDWLHGPDRDIKPILLDVRELREYYVANIKKSILIPLSELSVEMKYLDVNLPYVCFCHHGIRSAKAVSFLKENGFKQVYNLTGGIESWSNFIDSSIPIY